MFRKPTLKSCLKQLGDHLLNNDDLKAVMMSKNEDGDVVITLVEGIEESHKVRFGRIDWRSRTLIPHTPEHEGNKDVGVRHPLRSH
jgi:hypothetical protein